MAVPRTIVPLAVAVLVAATGTALAGPLDGRRVGGFTVSDIHYGLDPADPTLVSSVSFAVSPRADQVRVRLASQSDVWARCTPVGERAVCSLAHPVALRDVDVVDVLATSGTF